MLKALGIAQWFLATNGKIGLMEILMGLPLLSLKLPEVGEHPMSLKTSAMNPRLAAFDS